MSLNKSVSNVVCIYIYIYFHRLYRYLVWRLFVEVVMIMSLNPNENVSNVVYLYIGIQNLDHFDGLVGRNTKTHG